MSAGRDDEAVMRLAADAVAEWDWDVRVGDLTREECESIARDIIAALDLPALIAEAKAGALAPILALADEFDAWEPEETINPEYDDGYCTALEYAAQGDHVVSETRTAREPLLVSAMRRNPTGEVRIIPEGGGVTGTTTRGLLAELDEWVAALIAEARGEALREAADDALGMYDPPVADCIEWSEWLRARADRAASTGEGEP